ncbi:GTP 3',8-cyclase [Clostridiales bacterium]|nr:GTP 3',8-cyclase [Clostridiales bacterium]
MVDCFGRKIDYLRVSITDSCDLRCKYCMPRGIEKKDSADILSFEEITEICKTASELGIKYIRLTGGEPLARKGIEKLISMLRAIDNIERITMTTNGVRLGENLNRLLSAGLDGVNISLDTLDRDKYKSITGFDCLNRVINNLNTAYESGIAVKVNAVLIEENVDECLSIIELAKDRKIDVRFIEMMPIGEGKNFCSIDCKRVLDIIKQSYPSIYDVNEEIGAGPAKYYHIPGFEGNIGFINAVHESFCYKCNRIRLTSTGFLKACLCYDKGADLNFVLRNDNGRLKDIIKEVIMSKPEGHCFKEADNITEYKSMRQIGG